MEEEDIVGGSESGDGYSGQQPYPAERSSRES